MNIAFFAQTLAEICARSLVVPGRQLRWLFIANPTAGGFVIPSRWKQCRKALEAGKAALQASPLREGSALAEIAVQFTDSTDLAAYGLVPTTGPGCASRITGAIIAWAINAVAQNAGAFIAQAHKIGRAHV